ncbi:MAG: type II toxin-antitoxin system PemK/MazF family toxin [Nitrosotalea sp.]
MKSGIRFEQGEIVFVPFPFTNLTSSKKRPVLILSRTEYNSKSLDFVCCGITSNIKKGDHSVVVQNKDLLSGFLPKSSMVKANIIFTLERSIVLRSLGKVNGNTMEKVKKAVYDLF